MAHLRDPAHVDPVHHIIKKIHKLGKYRGNCQLCHQLPQWGCCHFIVVLYLAVHCFLTPSLSLMIRFFSSILPVSEENYPLSYSDNLSPFCTVLILSRKPRTVKEVHKTFAILMFFLDFDLHPPAALKSPGGKKEPGGLVSQDPQPDPY